MESVYLKRYGWQGRLFPKYVPHEKLSQVVVIPCFKEPDLISALDSLNACNATGMETLLLVVVNESDQADELTRSQNQKTLQELSGYHSRIPLLYAHQVLPHKKAGVGLARKIGMDEAVRFFKQVGNDEGVIICYDADCLCDANYFTAISDVYADAQTNAGVVFYEHRLNGEHHEEITSYELYLRYYIDGLRYAGFPHAHQTLGSCITVRSAVYEKVGGMNTRKAGEDFYFLNKTIPHGGFAEINETTVRPADRISDRVPFGTGKAVGELVDTEMYQVYNPLIFEQLKIFFDLLNDFWNQEYEAVPKSIRHFLGLDWKDQLSEVRGKVASKKAFEKAFFQWFSAFKILKFVHYVRDHVHSNVPLEVALTWFSEKIAPLNGTRKESLNEIRSFDRAKQVSD